VRPAGVALGYWQDADPLEALTTAALADDLGYGELWLGEMATFDAFALATAVGLRTSSIGLTLGPLAPAVRDATGLAMGVASVAALVGRPVQLAIGASSPVVVERWHGRSYDAPATLLRETVAALRPLLDGDPPPGGGYRLRLEPPRSTITVAAFGPAAVRVAVDVADRMVINLCTPAQAAALKSDVRLAAWVPAAIDPTREAIDQLRRGVVPYLAAPGYGEMFTAAGFGDVVALARSGAHPRDVLAAVPRELVAAIAILDPSDLDAWKGVDELVVVPATAGDPGGRRTLEVLAAQ
jgi:probable F420-dependent oxidoreductase